jgi:hypothetical protein
MKKGLSFTIVFVSFYLAIFNFAPVAFAATNIYYSVGQSTADLITGTPTVTVSSTTGLATFTTAQTDNIGVGDRVTIGNMIVYIASKSSSTAWFVVTATGTLPMATTTATVTSIKHEYTSLASAIAGAGNSSHANTTDLVGSNYILNLPCYGDYMAMISVVGVDTATVNVTGYTTGASNFIKIYTPVSPVTEVNYRQRHNGKVANIFTYMLNPSTSGNALTVQQAYTLIEGLDIYDYGGSGVNASAISLQSGSDYSQIASNLIHEEVAGNNGTAIMATGSPIQGLKIYNNLLYKLYNGVFDARATTTPIYLYNNTVIQATSGFDVGSGAIVAINNMSQNCSDGFAGTYYASSTNNLSDLSSDAPGTNPKNSTVVSFSDALNKDYSLSPSDTQAKNAGVNLSTDANLVFNTDIDGQTRSSSQGWDIGADEAATAIYYSVGQNTSDHKTGSPTVTISSSTGLAIFSVAQTGTTTGVGDVITYGANKCYITAKASTTAWYCATATGTPPVATTSATVTSIAHAFNSLSSAIAGASGTSYLNTTDLSASNYQLNLPCYYDTGPDAGNVNVGGYITGITNYIRIYAPTSITTEVNANQRHLGYWDAGKFSLQPSASYGTAGISVGVGHLRVDGLQFYKANGQGGGGISSQALIPTELYLSNNFIRGSNGGTWGADGLYVNIWWKYWAENIYIWNNMIIDWRNTSNNEGNGITLYSYGNMNILNNTVINCYNGLTWSGSNMFVKNNLFQSTVTTFTGIAGIESYNITDQAAVLGGTGSKNSIVANFVNSAAKNYHLSAMDANVIDAATNLSADPAFAFSTDIDGESRGSTWDVGADEYVNTGVQKAQFRIRNNTMQLNGSFQIQ